MFNKRYKYTIIKKYQILNCLVANSDITLNETALARNYYL